MKFGVTKKKKNPREFLGFMTGCLFFVNTFD
jgi:hypothetical protein